MSYQFEIEQTLRKAFTPLVLEVLNESDKHRGHLPKTMEVPETHFLVKMVSSSFNGLTRIQRHRLVYQILQDYIPFPIHALRLQIFGEYEQSHLD